MLYICFWYLTSLLLIKIVVLLYILYTIIYRYWWIKILITVTQKRMIPKCSNLVQGITLGYPTSDMILGWKVKVKGQR